MSHKLFREDFMLDSLIKIFKLHWEDDDIPYLEDDEGNTLNHDEYRELEVTPIIEGMRWLDLGGGEHFIDCDAILLWGDGCLEFHDKEEYDAYNWYDFDEESLVKIENYLKTLLK